MFLVPPANWIVKVIFSAKICGNTTDKSKQHVITIDNLKNGEILNHSLIICTGHVENLKETKCNPLSHLLIKSTNNESTKANINSNNFKFLIDLKLGTNEINIYFCCVSTTIALEFKPRNTNLCVVPLYIICKGHDGSFQAPETESNTPESACKRILTGSKLIQSLYAEKLYEAGFGRKTFQLKTSTCVIFHSDLHFEEVYKMGQLELWYYFAREIMSSNIGDNNTKYLAYLSCTNYNGSSYSEDMKEFSEIIGLTQGYAAFGGEGLALLSTACLYTWPESIMEIERRFNDKSVVDRRKFMDDSCYRGTLGGCFATTLGATLHELSHTFNLGHTESGIMARGFDNIQNVFLSKNIGKSKQDLLKLRYSKNMQNKSDEIYWTENCLIFLNFHRWFNDFNTKRKCILQYDANTKIIKSTVGIRVVEIRRKSDEMVLQYWVFRDKVLKYSFQINERRNREDLVLVVEDNEGNILKETF